MTEKEEIAAAIVRMDSWIGIKAAPEIEEAIMFEAGKGPVNARTVLGIVWMSSDPVIKAVRDILFATIEDEHADWLTELEWQNALRLARAINR